MHCSPPKWGLDLRSIALFRIGLAIVFLLNLFERSSGGQLELFFPAKGVLPPGLVSSPEGLSLLDGLSYPTAIGFMVLAAVFGVFFLVGYLTSLSRWVCFAVLVLLAHRFPLFIEGAESSFRLFFLLGCLLPLGDRFSVDSWLRRRRELSPGAFWRPRNLEMTLPIFYICLTLAGMYFCNASIKSRSERWWDGRAFEWVVQDVNYSVRPLGLLAREYLDVRQPHVSESAELVPPVYVVMSRGILFLEFILPVFILLALRFEAFRMISFLLILGFHGGIWLWMSIGPFSLALMACSFLFVPSFGYRLLGRLGQPEWGLSGSEPAGRRGVFWGSIAPSVCFFALLPLWLGNPLLKGPFASVLPAVEKYNSVFLRFLHIRQEWMQFSNPSNISRLGFVEVVKGGTSEFFLRNRPAHTAGEFYRGAYRTNQFAHLYLGAVMGSPQMRRLLADRLFSQGAERVVFWQFVYSPIASAGNRPYDRVLVETVLPEKRAAFSLLAPGGASIQSLRPYFERGAPWKFPEQFFWMAREGQERGFQAGLPAPVAKASLHAVRAPDYGRFRVLVNGTSIGEVDFYGSHVGAFQVPISPALLRVGRNEVFFECVGKSPASANTFLGVSGLVYEPLGEAPSPLGRQTEP